MISTFVKNPWLWLLGAFAPVMSFAEEHAVAAATGPAGAWGAPAAALGIALAVFGAATAQGKIASAFMEGVSRNPGAESVMKTQLILSLVFVETLVIFTLGIVVMVLLKV